MIHVRVKVDYILKQIKAPLAAEHALPLIGFVCKKIGITFGGSSGQTGVAFPM